MISKRYTTSGVTVESRCCFPIPRELVLTDPPAVLVQGRALAPHTVVLPEEIPDYWRELFDGFSWPSVQELESEQFQRTMDWYFWPG